MTDNEIEIDELHERLKGSERARKSLSDACDVLIKRLDVAMAANSDVRRIAEERNMFERENAELRDALYARLSGDNCPTCKRWFMVYGDHAETCPHAETELKVWEAGK